MEENKNDPVSNLSTIFSSNGENKEAWSDLLCNVISGDTKKIQEITSFLKQNLINKEKVNLTLDVIDFLLNYGSTEIIEQIAQKDFLSCIIALLKNKAKSGVEIQKKIIFLTQKWHQKFEKEENQNLKGFADNYNSLKNGGVIFPPSTYKIQTYNNYISEEESQNSLIKANAIKKLSKESEEIKKTMNANFANPFSSENSVNATNNNVCLDSDEEIPKKEEDVDEENPYLQKNEKENQSNNNLKSDNINNNDNNNNYINLTNNKNDNNINNYTFNDKENNNLPNFSEQKNQESKYPNYPSQMSNLKNNNNFNNNNQNDNPYKVRSKTMNIPNNQFSNLTNNYNNNNFNQNNINNNNYNNNNFPNNNNNYQNNQDNNNFNNNKLRSNNNNYPGQADYSAEARYYKRLLGNKLLQLNAWINDGKYSFNSGKLKEGIQEIINEIPNCNNMMRNYQQNGDRKAYETIRNMRMDIEQTCARYEALMNERKVEPFFSSFSGNTRQYYFDKNNLFGIQQNPGFGNFDNYYKSSGFAAPVDYGYQDNSYKKEESFGDKLSDFGKGMKDGFVTIGKAIKNTAVSGYEFVKKKIEDD